MKRMSQIPFEDRDAEASLADARARSARLEAAFRRDPGGYRVLTGDRPTGPLHLGHYFGTLLNRVRLQNLGVQTMVLVADYQTIIDRDSPSSLPSDVEELVADYLAVGIDPGRTTIFAHSQVAELNQLMIPFLSLVSVPELARNPTVKEERALRDCRWRPDCCSPIRSTRRRTSCSVTETWCRSARTNSRTSR